MLIQIKDFQGGMVTNADPTDLGTEFVVNNENFLTDQAGRIKNRLGRSVATTINTLHFDDLRYWSPSNLKLNGTSPDSYWIGYDYENSKDVRYVTSNILSATSSVKLGETYSSNIPTAFNLQDHGTEFRLAPNDLNHGPKILQYIARNYFESSLSVDEYVFQDALLDYPSSTGLNLGKVEAYTMDSSDLGISMPSNTYNYKISPIFDGTQELPLHKSFQSKTIASQNKIPTLAINTSEAFAGTAPNKDFELNPRITALKIYRETANSGTYYNIATIPINTKLEHPNRVSSMAPGTVMAGKDYVFSNTFIDDYTALTSATGIFSQPDVTTSTHNLLAYKWIIVMRNDTGTLDSVNNPDNSPTIFQGGQGSETSDTFSWSGVNGPLDDSSFLTYLEKGFASISAQPSGTPFYNFDGGANIKIYRRVMGVNINTGQSEIVGSISNELTYTLSDVVWHNKVVHCYSLSNAQRFTKNEITGGVFKNYQSSTYTNYLIVNSLGKSIHLDVVTDSITGNGGEVFRDYLITKEPSPTNTNAITFYDVNIPNGTPQPFPDDFKVKVNYKYSQMMGNRLFVGNVRLDPGGDDEDHPDWVVFSEPGMPDILPIVNYIQIKDQQGGEIVAMNKILDSLVIFMSRGIFRLDVGVTGDPSAFTLMESEQNLGCISPKGVINIKDNLFFCAKDNIYQISPDFTFTAISEPIKDIYLQTATPSASRLFYDVKRNRIICKFGTGTQVYYIYDLNSSAWSKWTTSINPPDFFTINDTLDVYAINAENVSSGGGGSDGGGSGDTGGGSGGDSGGGGGGETP
ncbi:MAG: hypothetical protein Unbinned6224contig1001_30 [Prokaryotic dsDNA virus sp.]|mgnify:CR=1 FL=1|nr:MAG: hypothetical protein Unbinned6224contig1001_30 [Prokaryotic dsDNA virus sp.]|tara:strand:- start:1282 stop:3687 length:2406 start_codon:yes stop_codon:yes gene_type:complete